MFIGTMTRSQVEVELVATKAGLKELSQVIKEYREDAEPGQPGEPFSLYVELRAKAAALEAALKAVNFDHESGAPVPRLTNK